MMDTIVQAGIKERYDALYSNLKELYALFFETYVKVTGSYLLILGWLITSKDARAFIRNTPSVYATSLVTLVVLAALYITLCIRMWRKSGRIMSGLGALNYLEREYYRNYAISRYSISIIITGYLFIAAIVCVMLANVYYSPVP